MAPPDMQNWIRNFAKRKQSDAEFAGNTLYIGLVTIYIVINYTHVGLKQHMRVTMPVCI